MLGLKAKLYAGGAALLAALAFIARLSYLKKKRDEAQLKAEILEAKYHVAKVSKKIELEGKDALKKKELEIIHKLKEGNNEEFKGLDNLTDSNKWD